MLSFSLIPPFIPLPHLKYLDFESAVHEGITIKLDSPEGKE